MVISSKVKDVLSECIALLHIVLFIYAATNKILDFENFQIQLAQSPLLSSFAEWISYLVPAVEIIISIFLAFPKTRLAGLYASFSLMIMFSVYIIIMINFSPFVPCSCGGILEKMNWNQHLVFNIAFVVLGFIGVLISPKNHDQPQRRIPLALGTAVLSTALVVALYVTSEDMFHHRNNFTRRFPQHPAEFLQDYSLASASLYIAGAENGKVYLGDVYDPLVVTEIDVNLKTIVTHTIKTNEPNRRYRKLRVVVKPPNFYLSDGLEAFAFRGTINDWYATVWIDKVAYYNSFVPIDSTQAAIRALSSSRNENMLGVMRQGRPSTAVFNDKLLDKQIDGVFDTDGILLYNDKHRKLLYVYAYRNEYLITDTGLQLKNIGNTIDTTSRAKIKVAYLNNRKASKLASPARIVNKTAATDGDFLYVNSKLIGQFEPESTWREASIIDVYNFISKTYLFSFHLYDKEQNKVSEFVIDHGRVYALAGRILTVYNLDPIPFEKNN